MKEQLKKFGKNFSDLNLLDKLQGFARQAGLKVVYMILLLFYAYRRKDTPGWAKRIVIGTLGYFIAIFDAIPDLTPIIGYTDDIGILSFGLVTVASYINEDVRGKAKEHLHKWFGEFDENDLAEIDEQL